jgi:ABC-2 type transport system permease protein
MTALVATAQPGLFTYLRACARLEIRRAFRNRRYVIVGIAIPVAFYLLYSGILQRGQKFGAIDGTPWATYFMVSMASYGAMVAGLFTAQVIAVERSQGWTRLLRVTPLPPAVYVLTKIVVSIIVTLPAAALVIAAGVVVNGVDLGAATLLGILAVLVIGSLPFAALGIFIGYLVDANSAQPVTVITTFGLAILGGLWAPVAVFPDFLVTIAQVLPSYHFAQLGRAVVDGELPALVDIAVLVAYGVLFGGLVFRRYRRDELRARG